jgi:hypothetical protein
MHQDLSTPYNCHFSSVLTLTQHNKYIFFITKERHKTGVRASFPENVTHFDTFFYCAKIRIQYRVYHSNYLKSCNSVVLSIFTFQHQHHPAGHFYFLKLKFHNIKQ